MYGKDPVLPITDMLAGLTHPDGRTEVDFDSYTVEMTTHMASAWQAAKDHIRIAQSRQKQSSDKSKKAKLLRISEGDHVMLYIPAERSNQAYKFAWPFRGPYQV